MTLIIDAHLDLSWNALSYDRDQTLPVKDLRRREAGMEGKSRGMNTVSLPEMRRGKIGICLATILARALPPRGPRTLKNVSDLDQRRTKGPILRDNLDFANQEICSATARGQLAYYRLLEARGELTPINDRKTLDRVARQWSSSSANKKLPVGYILSMEGADPILNDDDANWWWDQGLRTLCLAHYGQSAYAMGTGGDGPLTPRGKKLLRRLDKLGMILDLVHTADTALAQAINIFDGPVFVSHGNCRALVPGDRQISDEQIKAIARRGGILGVVLDCWMLDRRWKHDRPSNAKVTLATLADHIDHICQLTGSVAHAAIGSDLDGGFGTEQSPADLDTIADLRKLGPILKSRGYTDGDVAAVFHGNWLRFFRESLPRN